MMAVDPMWKTHLVPNTAKVTEGIFVKGALLDRLVSDGLVDMTQREEIDLVGTESGKATELFKILIKRPPDSFDKFCRALDETGQGHLAKILRAPRGVDTANYSRRRLDVLRDDYTDLSQKLRVNHAFLGYLFQERVISEEEYEELSSDGHTTAKKINILVMNYLLRGSDDNFDKILKALRVSEQDHLADQLQSSLDKKTKGGDKPDVRKRPGKAKRVSEQEHPAKRLRSSDKETKGGDKPDGRKRPGKAQRVSEQEHPAKRLRSSDKGTKGGDEPDRRKRSGKALTVSKPKPRAKQPKSSDEKTLSSSPPTSSEDEPDDSGKRSADDVLAKQATEEFLDFLAEQSQNNWRDIAPKLGFSRAEMGAIEKKYVGDVKEQCIEMLCKWLNREGRAATLGVLKEAYEKAKLLGQFETAMNDP